MPLYRMAGLYVKMDPRHERLKKYAEKYLCDFEQLPSNATVIDINISEEYVKERQKESPHLSIEDCEYIWFGYCLGVKLLKNNGFILHSSAVMYENKAYLFSADSGTGKSTHTHFWQEVFGSNKAVIINDDKPAIREVDGVFYASGTPFSGKSDLSTNVVVPVKALCFIYRSDVNEIRKLDSSEALELIFEQIFRPKQSENIVLLLDVLDSFFKKVPVYSLGVTYTPESAEFAYREINKV